jgi:hypothetical protein
VKRSQKGTLRPGLAIADRIPTESVDQPARSRPDRVGQLDPCPLQSAFFSHTRHVARQGPSTEAEQFTIKIEETNK